jgi:hypothetical protein
MDLDELTRASLFDDAGLDRLALGTPIVTPGVGVTHLRYPVLERDSLAEGRRRSVSRTDAVGTGGDQSRSTQRSIAQMTAITRPGSTELR